MRIVVFLGTSALAALGACASATPAPKPIAAPAGQPAASVTAPPAPTAPAGPAPASAEGEARVVPRAAVHAVVSSGLGAFLQRVDLDDQPVFVGGKFHGFRISALRDGASWSGFWSGVDLRPGDVVTRINGFPIERPDEAQTAFESLEVASELRVAYERGGQVRELVYAIVDR